MSQIKSLLVALWNHSCPVGTRVLVLWDNGAQSETVTRSEAWQLGDGSPVVMIQGVVGCYALERCEPIFSEDQSA